jgi:hypothetical protein
MVVVGAIAAGEKVVASKASELYMFLRSNYSDAVAVEMEGFGALAAVIPNPVSMMVIRGISDVLGIYSEVDIPHGQAQEIASQNASAFAFALLAKLNIENNISDIQRSQEVVTIDLDEDEGIDQPFDPAQIRIESKSMTIDLLLKRIQYRELNLSPDFQRIAGIWKPAVQSRLIESLLISILMALMITNGS